MGKTPRHGVLGRRTALLNVKGLKIFQNTIERNHPLRYTPSLLYLESCCDGIWRSHIRESIASPRPPPKISFKDNWMKELGSEVAGSSKDSQRIQPKSKTQLSRTGRLVSEQPLGSFTHGKDVLFGREGTKNSRTKKPVNAPSFSQSCVPVSVELVDKDENADGNADADQTRTGDP